MGLAFLPFCVPLAVLALLDDDDGVPLMMGTSEYPSLEDELVMRPSALLDLLSDLLDLPLDLLLDLEDLLVVLLYEADDLLNLDLALLLHKG